MTLHWFVHPLWFQEMGAFTKEENISVYVEWAQLAFKLFGEDHGAYSIIYQEWRIRLNLSSGKCGADTPKLEDMGVCPWTHTEWKLLAFW